MPQFLETRYNQRVPGIFSIFIFGFFRKRTTGSAAITGIITGFVMPVIFNNYAAAWFGHETILYTAYPKGHGGILFLICMGLSFLHTLITMLIVSLFGPKINPKAFELDKAMFKVAPSTLALIILHSCY